GPPNIMPPARGRNPWAGGWRKSAAANATRRWYDLAGDSVLPAERMRTTLTLAFAVTATVGLTVACAAAPSGPEPVEITQDNVVLKAVWFRPDGAGPFPAVIGMHGCEGLLGRNGTLENRYSDWAEHLTKAGFVVLYPDSYGSRGLGSQCSIRRRAV